MENRKKNERKEAIALAIISIVLSLISLITSILIM